MVVMEIACISVLLILGKIIVMCGAEPSRDCERLAAFEIVKAYKSIIPHIIRTDTIIRETLLNLAVQKRHS